MAAGAAPKKKHIQTWSAVPVKPKCKTCHPKLQTPAYLPKKDIGNDVYGRMFGNHVQAAIRCIARLPCGPKEVLVVVCLMVIFFDNPPMTEPVRSATAAARVTIYGQNEGVLADLYFRRGA